MATTRVYYVEGELAPGINAETVRNFVFNNLHATYCIAEVVADKGYLNLGGAPFLICAIHSYSLICDLRPLTMLFKSFTAHGIESANSEMVTIEWDQSGSGTFIEQNSEIRSRD